MISEETLNHTITSKHFKGWSLAFALARNLCADLLRANDYYLARMITSDTLNFRTPEGKKHCDESLAFHLASTEVGREILMHDNYRLLKMISEETLNHIITSGHYKGWSLAFPLALTEDGRKILMHDNYRLLNMISEETLHHQISNGPYKGKSIECFLLSTLAGCIALEHRCEALSSEGYHQFNRDSKARAKTLSMQDEFLSSLLGGTNTSEFKSEADQNATDNNPRPIKKLKHSDQGEALKINSPCLRGEVPYGSASSSPLSASGGSGVVSNSCFFGGPVQFSDENSSRNVLADGFDASKDTSTKKQKTTR
jgi:hypothetical protein